MRMNAYTVRDSAAEAFNDPFFLRTHGEALRYFAQAVNQENHPFNQHPDDYTMFHIGEFCTETGHFFACDPHSLGLASQFIEREVNGG